MRSRSTFMAALVLALLAAPAVADWPAYRHDNRRSGLTEETLPFPLAAAWVRTSAAPPAPAWHGPAQADYFHRKFELHALDNYDTAFHPVVANGRVYYGSSASDTLYCVDAATGETLWQLVTEGPIRLAPALFDGRVYVGSDDGNLYCANAETGEVEWTYTVSAVDRRLPGNGRMISRWPIRCGVAVEGGNVYFAAGVFPSAGLYLCAVDATSGEQVWKQPVDRPIRGHLVASETRLYATAGRTGCEVYDRANGNRVAGFGGGAFAVLVDPATEKVVAGPDEGGGVTGLDGGVRDKVASVQSLQLVARGEEYFVSTAEMIAAVTAARELRWKIEETATYALALAGDALIAGGDGQVTAYNANDGEILWQAEIAGQAHALAIDGGRLFVGTSDGTLYCFAAEGIAGAEPNHTADSPSSPQALDDNPRAGAYAAIAQQLLTFASGEMPVAEMIPRGEEPPAPRFNPIQGYCLVIDCGEGQLVYELARLSNLQVIGVERDAAKIEIARERLHAAGLYGRATIHHATGEELPYQGRTFNLVVCDRLLTPAEVPSYPAATVQDLLRPYGGTLVVLAGGYDPPIDAWVAESNAQEMLHTLVDLHARRGRRGRRRILHTHLPGRPARRRRRVDAPVRRSRQYGL